MLNTPILKHSTPWAHLVSYCPFIHSSLSSTSWKSVSTSCPKFPTSLSWLHPLWPAFCVYCCSSCVGKSLVIWRLCHSALIFLPLGSWFVLFLCSLLLSLHFSSWLSFDDSSAALWRLFSLGCLWPILGLTLYMSSVSLSQGFHYYGLKTLKSISSTLASCGIYLVLYIKIPGGRMFPHNPWETHM